MTEAVDIGAHLRAARKELGWTLREAERRSGVPNAHISQLETGAIRSPEVATLSPLAKAYGIPLADLVPAGTVPPAGQFRVTIRVERSDGQFVTSSRLVPADLAAGDGDTRLWYLATAEIGAKFVSAYQRAAELPDLLGLVSSGHGAYPRAHTEGPGEPGTWVRHRGYAGCHLRSCRDAPGLAACGAQRPSPGCVTFLARGGTGGPK